MYPSLLASSPTLQATFQFRGPPTCYNAMNGSRCTENENQTRATKIYIFLSSQVLFFFSVSFFWGRGGGGGRKDVGVGHVSVPSYTEDTYTNTFHELELQYMESTEM